MAGCIYQAIFQAPQLVSGILPKAILEHNHTCLPPTPLHTPPPARGSVSSSQSSGHLPALRAASTPVSGLWQMTLQGSAPLHSLGCQAPTASKGLVTHPAEPTITFSLAGSPAIAHSRSQGSGSRHTVQLLAYSVPNLHPLCMLTDTHGLIMKKSPVCDGNIVIKVLRERRDPSSLGFYPSAVLSQIGTLHP